MPDQSAFECSVIVGATCGGSRTSEKAFWEFYMVQCLEFTENGVMNKNHPVRGFSAAINNLMKEDGGARLVKANSKVTNAKITAQDGINVLSNVEGAPEEKEAPYNIKATIVRWLQAACRVYVI